MSLAIFGAPRFSLYVSKLRMDNHALYYKLLEKSIYRWNIALFGKRKCLFKNQNYWKWEKDINSFLLPFDFENWAEMLPNSAYFFKLRLILFSSWQNSWVHNIQFRRSFHAIIVFNFNGPNEKISQIRICSKFQAFYDFLCAVIYPSDHNPLHQNSFTTSWTSIFGRTRNVKIRQIIILPILFRILAYFTRSLHNSFQEKSWCDRWHFKTWLYGLRLHKPKINWKIWI